MSMFTTGDVSKDLNNRDQLLTEEKQKRNAVENQNIRHMGNMRVREYLHLLLCSTHEEEARGVEQERSEILEAVGVGAIGRRGAAIAKHKRNLNDPGDTGSHKGVAKDGMNHAGERQSLRMRRHAPASEQNHNARNEIALRSSVPRPTEPDANQAGTPPDDAHCRVLQVVPDPRSAPAMLGKGVDTAPRGDDERVEEFLASSCPAQPQLPDEQQNGEDDSVGDEGTSHDEVRGTLAHVVAATESQGREATEKELRPGRNRQQLARNAMGLYDNLAYLAVYATLEVKLQVDTHAGLGKQEQHEPRCEFGVHVGRELAAFVLVAQEIACDGEDGAGRLDGYVPLGPYHAEHHAQRKHDAPGQRLYQDVDP